MQKDISIKLKPAEASDNTAIRRHLAQSSGVKESAITGFYKTRQSIDARSRQQVWVSLTLKTFIDEPYHLREIEKISFKEVQHTNKKVIIVGAGPAGLFAALCFLEKGIQPIII